MTSKAAKIWEDLSTYLGTSKFIFSVLGVILLFSTWQIASLFMHDIILASPLKSFSALFRMMASSRFWNATLVSVERMSAGILLGGLAGFILGILAGLNEKLKHLLEPTRWLIMSVSPVIVVVIAMLWFGMGTKMVISISSFLLAPIVYVNTMKGVEMVDEQIVEMARVYKFNTLQLLRHIYIPALAGPLSAAMTIIITTGTRMIVLAEVLGTNSGIGYELSFARTDLNTPELYAWVLVTLILVGMAEFLFFKPLENYFLRWKNA
ncbi:MAG: ABC transporter permease [Bacteroidetes bacterium]|nr:MAG: ABC transporter permease [Bacteroidota bacterium]